VYGRYQGDGSATVTLTGQVQGRDINKSVDLPFPEIDATNPEIERMWAQKRIGRLLKNADRRNDRQSVLDEVVRLGETYSIVTEYTSFLVLENDGEYQRWKIERRNQQRLLRDRSAQTRRAQALEALREKAIQGIGPQPVLEEKLPDQAVRVKPTPATAPQVPQSMQPNTVAPVTSRPQSRNFGGGFGSGPVGPLFVGLALLMRRRKKRN
jgi:hypothetical protein